MLNSELATRLHAYLDSYGYPLLDAVFHADGEFERIEVWDDHATITRLLVCCYDEQRTAAEAYARQRAAAIKADLEAAVDGPVDVFAAVVTESGMVVLE